MHAKRWQLRAPMNIADKAKIIAPGPHSRHTHIHMRAYTYKQALKRSIQLSAAAKRSCRLATPIMLRPEMKSHSEWRKHICMCAQVIASTSGRAKQSNPIQSSESSQPSALLIILRQINGRSPQSLSGEAWQMRMQCTAHCLMKRWCYLASGATVQVKAARGTRRVVDFKRANVARVQLCVPVCGRVWTRQAAQQIRDLLLTIATYTQTLTRKDDCWRTVNSSNGNWLGRLRGAANSIYQLSIN